jgi:geranylgeranyl diphosphate synthase type II
LIDLKQYLADRARVVDDALERFLNDYDGIPTDLEEAIRFSLFPGGKRLRPALAMGASEAVCGQYEPALPAACAIELIHTYSLVHDDLPCMDDDDIRRGLPTVHRKFGEAAGVLVGDALQTMSFEILAGVRNQALLREIAHAAGPAGMVGGQHLDVQAEGKDIELDAIRRVHRLKTGALIRVATRSGARLAKANREQLSALTAYGENIGLAFQIVDDILDVVGDDDEMGKRSGTDRARDKSTYPSLIGLDESRRLAAQARDDALDSLTAFGQEAEPLRALAAYVVERRR